MRYVIEFLIPAMIVIVVALVLFRNRPRAPAPATSATQANEERATLSTGTFVVILVVGAVFTIALVYALQTGAS